MTRVIVVLQSAPVPTQTFHLERIRQLHKLGILEGVFVAFPRNGWPINEPMGRLDFDSNYWTIARLLLKPRLWTRFLRLLAASRFQNGEGGYLGTAAFAWHGLRLGAAMKNTGGTYFLLASFATGAATICAIASVATDAPWGSEVHSPLSITRSREFLRLKLYDAAAIFPVSEYMKWKLLELDPGLGQRAHVIRPCHQPPRRMGSPATSGVDVLAIGSLIPKKGHDVLLHAWKRAAVGDKYSLGIVGDGPLKSQLQHQARQLGIECKFFGELDHTKVLQLIERAKVGVLASRRTIEGDEDGTPVALMEFMARGVAVASTAVAGIPEILDGGRVGKLVAPLAVSELARALAELLGDNDARLQLGAAGKQFVNLHFDCEAETRKMARLLQESTDGH